MVLVYPVSRLLANPRLFYIISNYLGGLPDAETLRDAFYDLLEAEVCDYPDDDITFQAQEVCFEVENEGLSCTIQFDTGSTLKLEAVGGDFSSQISSDQEFATASAIHRQLISAIEESHPELKDDISLEHPPTPGNSFLSSKDGERFEGCFHLRSDPNRKYSFTVLILDPVHDKFEAKIRPI